MAGRITPRILVIEDDADTRLALSSILGDAGYEVIEAADASDLVRRVRDGEPDLILLDLVLPKLSGLDALVSLKGCEQTRDVPVVVVTALSRGVDLEEARAGGASACIVKPWASGQVERCIEQILASSCGPRQTGRRPGHRRAAASPEEHASRSRSERVCR